MIFLLGEGGEATTLLLLLLLLVPLYQTVYSHYLSLLR